MRDDVANFAVEMQIRVKRIDPSTKFGAAHVYLDVLRNARTTNVIYRDDGKRGFVTGNGRLQSSRPTRNFDGF